MGSPRNDSERRHAEEKGRMKKEKLGKWLATQARTSLGRIDFFAEPVDVSARIRGEQNAQSYR
jgi:hypothetical protein